MIVIDDTAATLSTASGTCRRHFRKEARQAVKRARPLPASYGEKRSIIVTCNAAQVCSSKFQMLPLFEQANRITLEEGAVWLRGFAAAESAALTSEVARLAAQAGFRHLVTPGGRTMSVAMTNCGRVGWLSDRKGYRYDPFDPETGLHWPPMPQAFLTLAVRAAAEAGFEAYDPDACLINRYEPGSRLGLHQDRDENDSWAPIVSVSLGLPATFLWGGRRRADPQRRLQLENGDVVVWGGPARFVYHGVAPLKPGEHDLTGPSRINLTFRKVF